MIKARMVLFMVITLFLVMGVGCDEKNEKNEAKTILPVSDLSEQVVTFFETELPNAGEANCFFCSQENDAYYLINSMDELQAVYSCDNELPEIDFSQYSVIIGQHGMTSSFYSVVEQRIEETEIFKLSIHFLFFLLYLYS